MGEQVPVNLKQAKKHLCPVCGRTAMGDGDDYFCPVCPQYLVDEKVEELRKEKIKKISGLTLL